MAYRNCLGEPNILRMPFVIARDPLFHGRHQGAEDDIATRAHSPLPLFLLMILVTLSIKSVMFVPRMTKSRNDKRLASLPALFSE